jgi:hypothetical protein
MGSAVDRAMQVLPFQSMMTAEAMVFLTRWAPTDDRTVQEQLGIAYRDPAETFAAAVAGAYAAGRLTARQAGRAALTTPGPR